MRYILYVIFSAVAPLLLKAQQPVYTAFPTTHFISRTQPGYFAPYIDSVKNASIADFVTADSLPPFQRYLYTQAVTVPPMIAAHAYLLALSVKPDKWHSKFKAERISRAFTEPPVFDHDHWLFNYGVHGYMGQMSYLAYRNRGGKIWQAYAVTTLNTITYEYFLASATQQPSINDLIVTPVLGLFLGEASYKFVKHLMHDKRLTFFEKVLIFGVDPVETVRNGFNYRHMMAKPF